MRIGELENWRLGDLEEKERGVGCIWGWGGMDELAKVLRQGYIYKS